MASSSNIVPVALAGRAWVAWLLVACACCAAATKEADVSKPPPAARILRDPVNGTIVEWKGERLSADLEGSEEFRRLQQANHSEGDVALAFLAAHADDLRLKRPREELIVRRTMRDEPGFASVRLRQVYRGIPVWAAGLVVTLDSARHVVRVAGRYHPTPSDLDLQPAISGDTARAAAERLSGRCNNCPPPLVVYFDRGVPKLAYEVDLVAGLAARWSVIVDARTGEVLHETSMAPTTGAVPRKP